MGRACDPALRPRSHTFGRPYVMPAIASPGSRVRLRLRRLTALGVTVAVAVGTSLSLSLLGVDDAPRRVIAELRAHGGTPLTGPTPARVATAVVAVEDVRDWHHGRADAYAHT